MTQKQLLRNEARKKENELKKAIAYEAASKYCIRSGLSASKLKTQRFDWIDTVVVFSQPSGVTPIGLTNDMDTMPLPTLILRSDAGKLIFEQTEYTKKYLGM